MIQCFNEINKIWGKKLFFFKGVTRACRVELQEIERLVYIFGLGKVKTIAEPSAAISLGPSAAFRTVCPSVL